MVIKKDYCTQNNGDCSTCSLANYGLDCKNNPVGKGGRRQGAGRPANSKTSERTARLGERLTPQEKIYLEQKLKEYRKS